MRHPSINRIKELSKLIEISDSLNCKEVCHVCPLDKQRRLSFPTLNNVVEHTFGLVRVLDGVSLKPKHMLVTLTLLLSLMIN